MISFASFFTEQVRDGKLVVIYPGRFQPAHKGHANLYFKLQQQFPDADIYIATSEKMDEKSPFTFNERKFLLEKLGIPGDKIVLTRSPYKPVEITSKYNSEKDSVIFALSEKDLDRLSFKPKKDGSPAYFAKFEDYNLLPLGKRGYVIVSPVSTFKVLGKPVTSATQIRDMYKHSSDQEREQIITDLYGRFDLDIYDLLNKKLK